MNRVGPLAFLLALLLGACMGDPRVHLEKARELAFQRRPAEALREYEEVLSLVAKKDPESVANLLVPALRGAGDICYLELRDLPKAVEYYRSLASNFPEHPETLDARANLADIMRALGDRRAAVAELIALVGAFPRTAEIDRYRYLTAKDYFELRDYSQAIVEAHALQERHPDSPYAQDAQMLTAASLLLVGQHEKAVQAYDEVVRRWPDSELAPRARFEKAKILADLGQDERAIEVLVEALKTHPNPRGIQAEITRLRRRAAARRLPEKLDAAAVWPPEHPAHGRVP